MDDAGAGSSSGGRHEAAADAAARDDHRVKPENVRAEALKERVYATFTGLAIVLVQLTNVDHLVAGRVAIELVVGILAITAAGLAADVISFLSVHSRFPDGHEVRVMLRIAASALASAGVPVVVLVLAAVGLVELETALRIVSVVYVVTLGVIAYLGVRRTHAAWWKQLVALATLMAVGLSVVLIQLAAHGH
ncbi:hypothetical protein [Agromyces sp. Leaf222]|uniref:hypothetical protein n=1 Tax=Agromyces sp. Leaf222 TaxID=1735688 RepID=UPI0006F7712C|nr:hypothetical protein [Agromyces sp. Leaf222]KQM82220.1 hypothetical protein ASE68_02005 [Agromyces sp. Leaf222]